MVDGMEERFRKWLGMWKKQCISKGGRTTLIKSTLSNLLIYYIFVSYAKYGEIVIRSNSKEFLLRRQMFGKESRLVRWSTVCMDKGSGGLGVEDLGCINKAFP